MPAPFSFYKSRLDIEQAKCQTRIELEFDKKGLKISDSL